jgi:hypothetical protein
MSGNDMIRNHKCTYKMLSLKVKGSILKYIPIIIICPSKIIVSRKPNTQNSLVLEQQVTGCQNIEQFEFMQKFFRSSLSYLFPTISSTLNNLGISDQEQPGYEQLLVNV